MRKTSGRWKWAAQVADALRARGIMVHARDIVREPTDALMRAHAWAKLGESMAVLPSWLAKFAPGPAIAKAPPRVGEQLSLLDVSSPRKERTGS